MRPYDIFIGILLILPTIDFAFAAPVLVQQSSQADNYVVHTAKDAKTKLGKQGSEAEDMWLQFFDHPDSHSPPRPEEPPAAPPSRSSGSQPSGPSDMPTDIEQPVPSIPKQQSQVASSSHAPPIPDDDESNKLWFGLSDNGYFDESLHTPSSWGSTASRPAHGWMDAEQPGPSIINEPSQEDSLGYAPPIPDDDGLNKLWPDLSGHRYFDESLLTPPSWGSMTSRPAHGWMDAEQPGPSITNEPSQEDSLGHAQPSPGDELNKLWLDLYGHRFPVESLVARPPGASQPSGPSSHSWTDVEKPLPPIHEEPVPVYSRVQGPPSLGEEWTKMWRDLIDRHSPAKLAKSSAARPSSSSQPLGPVASGGRTNVKQSPPSIHKGPALVSSQVPAPPRPGGLGEEWTKMWRDLIDRHFPAKSAKSSAARPSSSSQPSGPPGGSTYVKPPLPPVHEGPGPVPSLGHAPSNPGSLTESGYELMRGDVPHWPSGPASLTMSSAGHGLMGAHALPNSGLLTEWGHETMGMPQPIPVSSRKHDLQPIDAESPSGKRIKTKKKNGEMKSSRI